MSAPASLPLWTSARKASKIALGGAPKIGLMWRPTNSQISKNTASEATVTAQRGTPRLPRASSRGSPAAAWRSARSTMRASMHRCRAGVQRLPDVITGLRKGVGAADFGEIVARARQRHRDDLLQAAVLHDRDAVGE